MDLSDLAVSQDEFLVEIRHPKTFEVLLDDDGAPFTIGVLSSDTNKSRNAVAALKSEYRAKAKGDATAEELAELGAKTIAEMTTSCNLVFNKKKMKFSVDEMAKLLANPSYNWLKDQVSAAMDNRANFIKG